MFNSVLHQWMRVPDKINIHIMYKTKNTKTRSFFFHNKFILKLFFSALMIVVFSNCLIENKSRSTDILCPKKSDNAVPQLKKNLLVPGLPLNVLIQEKPRIQLSQYVTSEIFKRFVYDCTCQVHSCLRQKFSS